MSFLGDFEDDNMHVNYIQAILSRANKRKLQALPTSPLVRKPKTKDPLAKTCKSEALVSRFSCPSHLFASSCSGFSPPAITQDSHLGTNRVGRGGFCGAEGREEEGCLAGVRTGTSIKVSILCQLKCDCSATAPKNRAERAKNKAAERQAPPTSR